MTGLEKILQQIAADGAAEVAALTDKAQHQADTLLAETEKQVAELEKSAALHRDMQVKAIEAAARSGAELERRKVVLIAKQELIGETIAAAHTQLLALDDKAYFALVLKMIAASAQPKEGAIFFNQKDLDRLPKDFSAAVTASLAPIAGASLKIGDTPREIDGGFILTYGGIEENCSFESWFYAHREELQDRMNHILFGA